jgi:hypothetical protein
VLPQVAAITNETKEQQIAKPRLHSSYAPSFRELQSDCISHYRCRQWDSSRFFELSGGNQMPAATFVVASNLCVIEPDLEIAEPKGSYHRSSV